MEHHWVGILDKCRPALLVYDQAHIEVPNLPDSVLIGNVGYESSSYSGYGRLSRKAFRGSVFDRGCIDFGDECGV